MGLKIKPCCDVCEHEIIGKFFLVSVVPGCGPDNEDFICGELCLGKYFSRNINFKSDYLISVRRADVQKDGYALEAKEEESQAESKAS